MGSSQSLKTIRLFYIIYSVYTLFVILVSDYRIIYVFWGLLSIWGVYLAYSIGFRSRITKHETADKKIPAGADAFFFSRIAEWKPIYYIVIAIICWLCSVYAAKFYTSRGFISVVLGMFSGEQAYSIYQHYIVDANIGAFSISKIPYILMLAFSTMMLFWALLGILLSGKKIRPIQYVFVTSIVLSYFYFGIARGTNFEMYTIFVVVVYCLLNRPIQNQKDLRKRRRAIIVIFILGVLAILMFRVVVAARGNVFNNQICPEIHYDSNKMFSELFPITTNLGLSVFRYLGYGIFAIGVTVDYCLNTLSGFVALIIPTGSSLVYGDTLPNITRKIIDVGVGWVADYVSLLYIFGLPLLWIICFIFGRLTAKLIYSQRAKLLKDLAGALIFLEMLSIPVGNFIATSTPNKLVVLLVIGWYFKGKYLYKIKLKGR